MMKRTLAVVTTLMALPACSAGGSAGEGSTVTPSTSVPAVLMPGDTSPTVTPTTPAAANTGQLFDPEDVEPTDECDGTIPVVFRDFSEAHPDFEMDFSGDGVRLNLIAPTLGADKKPVFASSLGCPAQRGSQTCRTDYDADRPVITSAASFDQWYRNDQAVNRTFDRELELTEDPNTGLYKYSSGDFFPLTPMEGFGITPPGQGRNFLFTTEINLVFTYVAGQRFTFRGDDDLWIFINERLALDLGAMHGVEEGTIDFDAQAAALGIAPGRDYAMNIFHAERHTSASNFTIETNIACFTPGIVY